MRAGSLALGAAWLLLSAASAGAADISLSAEEMDVLPGEVIVARGKVSVTGSGFAVTGDELTYHRGEGRLDLRGHVEMLQGGKGGFRGERVTLDLDTMRGEVTRGSVTVAGTNLLMTGDTIRETGEGTYEVEGASFTTCPSDRCDWVFRARHLKVEKEGFLTASGSTFYLAGVPVFWVPYLLYPVKTQRQAGVLVPNFGYDSESGYEVGIPLYIPWGPSADVTLTPRSFSRVGLGGDLELRYLLEEGGGGDVTLFSLAGSEPEEKAQWYGRARHAGELVDGLWLRGRWFGAGDPEATTRFGIVEEDRHPGLVLSSATLEGGWPYWSLWAGESRLLPDARFWDEGTEMLSRRRFGAALGPFPAGPLWLGGTAERVVFDDGSERDLSVPSASLALPALGPARGRVEASWRGDGEGRGARVLRLSESASLGRTFGDGSEHRLDFFLSWARVGAAAFGSGLYTAPRDAEDAMVRSSLVTAEVASLYAGSGFSLRVRAGGWQDGERDYGEGWGELAWQWGALTLSAFANPDGEDATVLPNPGLPRLDRRAWRAAAGLSGRGGSFLVSRESRPDQDTGRVEARLPWGGVTLGGRADFDLLTEETTETEGTLGIRGPCWTAELAVLTRDRESDVRFRFALTP